MKDEDSVKEICDKLKGRLKDADGGTLAMLRRLRTDSPPPQFFQIITKILDDAGTCKDGVYRVEEERRWMVVASAMASGIVDKRTALFTSHRLGVSLKTAELSEQRLTRLLHASGESLHDAVRVTIHYLISKGVGFSPTSLARLVLSDGKSHARDVRQQIARDYYREISAKDSSSSDKKETT